MFLNSIVDIFQEQFGIGNNCRPVLSGIFPLEQEIPAAHIQMICGDLSFPEQV